MHELSIVRGILAIVEQAAKDEGFERVLEIRLKIGEYSGLVPACLQEFFPLASKGTPAEGALLAMETLPAVFRCLDCGYEGPVDRKNACCPRCRGTALRMTQGREFYVEDLKVE